jgi:uncharacterized membrane protein
MKQLSDIRLIPQALGILLGFIHSLELVGSRTGAK